MYYLFGGDHYYPSGGWNDFVMQSETLAECMKRTNRYDWCHIVFEGQIIYRRG